MPPRTMYLAIALLLAGSLITLIGAVLSLGGCGGSTGAGRIDTSEPAPVDPRCQPRLVQVGRTVMVVPSDHCRAKGRPADR